MTKEEFNKMMAETFRDRVVNIPSESKPSEPITIKPE